MSPARRHFFWKMGVYFSRDNVRALARGRASDAIDAVENRRNRAPPSDPKVSGRTLQGGGGLQTAVCAGGGPVTASPLRLARCPAGKRLPFCYSLPPASLLPLFGTTMKSSAIASLPAASRATSRATSALWFVTPFPFGRSARLFAAAAAALALRAGADPVRIDLADLADLKDKAFSAPGCEWDSPSQRLALDAGEYFLFDSAWKPDQSGTFYDATPGLNVVLGGDASITISNVVAVTRTESSACTNSVIDLAGHDLALTLCGANRFSVRGEAPDIRAAIHVPASSSLSIGGDGSLYAHVYGGAPACIGSNCAEDSGTIRILGGTVAANHENLSKCRLDTGFTGAAIGSGAGGNAGRVEIFGGSVTARSEAWAAAIGAGANYKGDQGKNPAVPGAGAFDILVSGGAVTATGGKDGGCGLGGGHSYDRASEAGACAVPGRIHILGGAVSAEAGELGENRASCASSAIGASMRNAGASVVVDSAATVSTTANSSQNNPVVSGAAPVFPGSLSFTCASGASDGHAFLSTPARASVKDVMPADAAARAALPWHVFTRDAILDVLQVSGSDSKGYSYFLPEFAPGSETAAAVGALSGLPITAFSLDGDVARFTYSRVGGTPSSADIAAFSAWFAAFGADVAVLARDSLPETTSTVLAPDPGTAVDNGDGTASFDLTLDAPVAPRRFFQLAW